VFQYLDLPPIFFSYLKEIAASWRGRGGK